MVDSKYAGSDNCVSLLLISCYWKCFPNDQISGVCEFGSCLIDFAMYSGCHNAPQIDYLCLFTGLIDIRQRGLRRIDAAKSLLDVAVQR